MSAQPVTSGGGAGNVGDTQFGNATVTQSSTANSQTQGATVEGGSQGAGSQLLDITVGANAASGAVVINQQDPNALNTAGVIASTALTGEQQTAQSAEDASLLESQAALGQAATETKPAGATFIEYLVVGVVAVSVAFVVTEYFKHRGQ